MSNSVFQSVIIQLKEVSDRVFGVIDTDGSVIGGEKTSGTVIGFEMEIDHQFFDKEDYKERYFGYEKAFGEFVGKYPTAYYAGCPDTAVKVADLMKKFLQQ